MLPEILSEDFLEPAEPEVTVRLAESQRRALRKAYLKASLRNGLEDLEAELGRRGPGILPLRV